MAFTHLKKGARSFSQREKVAAERPDERLSLKSSCGCEVCPGFAGSGVESDEKFAGESDAGDHFGFSGVDEFFVEVGEARVIAAGGFGDEEEDGAHAGATATDVALAGAGAAVVGGGGEPDG